MEDLPARKLQYFSELLTCGQQLWSWEYTPELQLVQTSCPWVETFGACFSLSVCREQLLLYTQQGGTMPLIMSDPVGFSWIAAFETAQTYTTRIHVIGPCFTSDVSSLQMEQELAHKTAPGGNMTRSFIEQVRTLPVIPLTTWFQLGLMLHFTITGEKISISDFAYPSEDYTETFREEDPHQKDPSRGTWLAEQEAMRMIEEGRLDYKSAMGHLSMSASFAAPVGAADPDRKMKNAVLSFITLCTRAAIRGGIDAETAYRVGNTYIDGIEDANTLSELMRLNSTMYDDFVQRVYKIKAASGVSSAVQACCNYIEFHLAENLTLKALAQNTGYTEFYLAQKFKKEIGVPVSKYIQQQRIERAKQLLHNTTKSVLEISEELGFCNTSYFSKIFRAVEGVSPTMWRKNPDIISTQRQKDIGHTVIAEAVPRSTLQSSGAKRRTSALCIGKQSVSTDPMPQKNDFSRK